jgi:hypothetical protein
MSSRQVFRFSLIFEGFFRRVIKSERVLIELYFTYLKEPYSDVADSDLFRPDQDSNPGQGLKIHR